MLKSFSGHFESIFSLSLKDRPIFFPALRAEGSFGGGGLKRGVGTERGSSCIGLKKRPRKKRELPGTRKKVR